jgi:hypothetical protein
MLGARKFESESQARGAEGLGLSNWRPLLFLSGPHRQAFPVLSGGGRTGGANSAPRASRRA